MTWCKLGFHDWEMFKMLSGPQLTELAKKRVIEGYMIYTTSYINTTKYRAWVCLRCGVIDDGISKELEIRVLRIKEEIRRREKAISLTKEYFNEGE